MAGNHLLLRKLVMSSITQLAEIAYDMGSLDDIELDLDEIDEDDKEVGASSLKRDDSSDEDNEKWSTSREGVSTGAGDRGQGTDDRESSQDDQKVSDKMKKMADNVRNNGHDDALESLLANLAVTAQYIESLENTQSDAKLSAEDNTVPKEATDQFETGEPGHGGQERHEHTSTASDISVKGPPPPDGSDSRRTGESEPSGDHSEYHSTRSSVSEEILAASDAELEKEEEVLEEFDSELVREIEHHLEETLAKQLNTNGQYIPSLKLTLLCLCMKHCPVICMFYSWADVTVKIVTLPLREGEEEGDREEDVSDGTNAETDSELSASMSRLIESLLVSNIS